MEIQNILVETKRSCTFCTYFEIYYKARETRLQYWCQREQGGQGQTHAHRQTHTYTWANASEDGTKAISWRKKYLQHRTGPAAYPHMHEELGPASHTT